MIYFWGTSSSDRSWFASAKARSPPFHGRMAQRARLSLRSCTRSGRSVGRRSPPCGRNGTAAGGGGVYLAHDGLLDGHRPVLARRRDEDVGRAVDARERAVARRDHLRWGGGRARTFAGDRQRAAIQGDACNSACSRFTNACSRFTNERAPKPPRGPGSAVSSCAPWPSAPRSAPGPRTPRAEGAAGRAQN
jgi:hypothetical protein